MLTSATSAASHQTESPAETVFGVAGPFLRSLDTFLESQIAAFEPELREIVAFALQHSGKRLRPILLFFAGSTDGRGYDERLVKAAAVVELVHLATLVHDDILDDAEVRHREVTVAKRYGNSAAILSGDALFAQALRLASDFETTLVCRLVSEATRKVCAGEVEQTFHRLADTGSLETYFRVIDRKTAELFRVACALGYALRDPSDLKGRESAARFGRHLGLAYQIFDDLVDVFGSEEEAGKTLGTDVEGGKLTLPLLLLRERLSEPDEGVVASWRTLNREDLCRLLEIEGVPAAVSVYFNAELERARHAAGQLPVTGSRHCLFELVTTLEDRMRALTG